MPSIRTQLGHWLPRTTDSLEDLDLLLVMVATPRVVHRDGIRFQGLRYLDPTLAAYVGEPVTIRYDPRDLGEIRVFQGALPLTTGVRCLGPRAVERHTMLHAVTGFTRINQTHSPWRR